MQKTKIEWTDYSANPIKYREKSTGRTAHHCEKVSSGCDHCYSEALAKRFGRGGRFARQDRDLYEPFLDEKELQAIMRLRFRCPEGVEYMSFEERERTLHMPRTFVGDMTDVFGEWVPDSMLDEMFATFACKEGCVFQLLTKRPERARTYLTDSDTHARITECWMRRHKRTANGRRNVPWPIPEVWIGVSVEDQKTADERIPHLLNTPAKVRFVSYEPALGPVDFNNVCGGELNVLDGIDFNPRTGFAPQWGDGQPERGLDWVIVGGESGPGSRPFQIQWARDTIRQCQEAGIACFVKQLGSAPRPSALPSDVIVRNLKDRKGGSMEEWPVDLRVRQWPHTDAREGVRT